MIHADRAYIPSRLQCQASLLSMKCLLSQNFALLGLSRRDLVVLSVYVSGSSDLEQDVLIISKLFGI